MEFSKRTAILAVFVLLSVSCLAQVNRYMVFFTDKNDVPFSVSDPSKFLSEKSLIRRMKHDAAVTEQDLPVNSSYVQGIKDAGAEVFFTTRWLNGVLVQCEGSLVPALEALSFVDHVEFVAPQPKLLNGSRQRTTFKRKNTTAGVESEAQLRMLGITDMHSDGYMGQGITIAVFDGGFLGVNVTAPFQHIIAEGRINQAVSHDFVRNTSNVYQYDEHGTEVFAVISAYVPDVFSGGAYKANYQLYITEDVFTEYRVEEYNWLFAAERADSAGVDIINSSLGYYDFDTPSMNYDKSEMDGKTTVVTRAAQWVADRGVVVVCSAGNEGNIPSWRIITAPADARDVIAVANVNAQGVVSSSSSIGPSADGRVKPDLAALGTGVRTYTSTGALSSLSGTSLAAPLITSLAAGVLQRFPYLTNKELIAALKNTASLSRNPNFQVGYGIPRYNAVVSYLDRQSLFHVFPNPIQDSVTVRPVDLDTVRACRVELISSQGQILAQETVEFSWSNKSFSVNLSHLAAGLYYYRIWLGKKKYVYKLVKL